VGAWQAFEAAAGRYEEWYGTSRGRRVSEAERALLAWLLDPLGPLERVLDVGCGTGHFTAWVGQRCPHTIGLDRAPAMAREVRRRDLRLPVVLGDAHRLPFRPRSVDAVMLVTSLEFLEEPTAALTQAVEVTRRGIVLVALNRWSLGGWSRRWGRESGQPLLGTARDFSLGSLRAMLRRAAGRRLAGIRWASTLFPDGLWRLRAPVPLGAVIGMVAMLSGESR
jgi:SAM-dependent methyltransferase